MPVFLCKKAVFILKSLKMAGYPNFFLRMFVQLNKFLRGVKKDGVLMFKVPDFSLAQRLCTQATLYFVSAC